MPSFYGNCSAYTQKMNQPIFDEEGLQLLACPLCRDALDRINSEALVCVGCGRRYPIRDGLPVLRADVTK